MDRQMWASIYWTMHMLTTMLFSRSISRLQLMHNHAQLLLKLSFAHLQTVRMLESRPCCSGPCFHHAQHHGAPVMCMRNMASVHRSR